MAATSRSSAAYLEADDVVVTELSNNLSSDIDVASPSEIVCILEKCDSEIFHGWKDSMGLLNESILKKCEAVIQLASLILQEPDKKLIVLSGCGTSGRIAFMIARTFNAKMLAQGKPACFDYLMAGGDETLFRSEELSEDDPHTGCQALEQYWNASSLSADHFPSPTSKKSHLCCLGKEKVLYIGITCGMSAPYVAGQLDHCMNHPDKFTPVLLGFNSVSAARNLPIEGWDKTFRDVAKQLNMLQESSKGFILNPLIGPEPITGSSRMKGGSATKILLEAILTSAYLKSQQAFICDLSSLILAYDVMRRQVFEQQQDIGKMIKMAGDGLRAGGHIYYLANHKNLGIVGLIDASECKPTYGSDPKEVMGFVDEGYCGLDNKSGNLSNVLDISTNYFDQNILKLLSAQDTVVLLTQDGIMSSSFRKALQSPAKTVIVNFKLSSNKSVPLDVKETVCCSVEVNFPNFDLDNTVAPSVVKLCEQQYVELGTKWACNALTTGAHILKGMVFKNIMINVGLNNRKLFHRALSIVMNCSGVSEQQAQLLLLKAVYQRDDINDMQHQPINAHIIAASHVKLVVPLALVMAQCNCALQQAKYILQVTPVLRESLRKM